MDTRGAATLSIADVRERLPQREAGNSKLAIACELKRRAAVDMGKARGRIKNVAPKFLNQFHQSQVTHAPTSAPPEASLPELSAIHLRILLNLLRRQRRLDRKRYA